MPKPAGTPKVWYMGVDPGSKGSASIIDYFGNPLLDKDGKIDCARFDKDGEYGTADWFRRITHDSRLYQIVCSLEKAQCRSGEGMSSQVTFGENAGFVRGLIVANKIPWSFVQPQAWQKALSITPRKTKDGEKPNQFKMRLCITAKRRWPKLADQIVKGNCDSLLIAEALRLKQRGKA